jgi:proline dehydrogenase
MSLKQRILYPFASRFFAGLKLDDAIRRAGELNARGMGATLDFLGEDVKDAKLAEAAYSEYARAIAAVSEGGLNASVAVKLTHLGLDAGRDAAEDAAMRLADAAGGKGVFLWVDMEGSAHTDDTIRIYRRLLSNHRGKVGVALQACLKRSPADMKSLAAEGAVIRLVKGAYREPPALALQDMSGIRAAFTGMMEYLFGRTGSFAIGTHDRSLIEGARALSMGYKGAFEFQMLMGMRDDLKAGLKADGHSVVEYVPYGTDWYGYGMRRLKEKRRNIAYFAQGLIGK